MVTPNMEEIGSFYSIYMMVIEEEKWESVWLKVWSLLRASIGSHS
jgi:hypothetical protein